EQVSRWPLAKDDPSYFHLTNLGTSDYWGLSVELASAAGPISVSVARAADADAIVTSLLREFMFDVAWVSPLLMLATLGIGVFVVRNGLKPVRDISQRAAQIGPASRGKPAPGGRTAVGCPQSRRSTGGRGVPGCGAVPPPMPRTSCARHSPSSQVRSTRCKGTAISRSSEPTWRA